MSDSTHKKQLLKHLKGSEAFRPLENFVDEIPFAKLGERPYNLPYSFYELFYHVVFAQKDILEYTISENYKASKWPDHYWPEQEAPQTENDWNNLKEEYFEDRKKLENFILEPENELNATVENSDNHNLLREILLIIEHTAYHTGQMIIILRLLGLYKK
ncbi:DinB family protein [Psychroflexus aestuariivivens]|uniref:DinB family protein n=1 Tax=Psychroflexus aestuariivivens TaxID=1795040 RepID=UPI000FDC9646|nr:DinB family protein [Psychroflexus aestuariivivens]